MGLAFGMLTGPSLSYLVGSPAGIYLGLAVGLSLGLLVAACDEWQRSQFSRDSPCEEGEALVTQGPALHFRNWEAVGGWLYLTDRRLIFRAHGFNVQDPELTIPLEEIREVKNCWMAWILPDGLRIVTVNGTESFVVQGRHVWNEEINRATGQLA